MILKQIDLELPQALHLFTSFIKLGWQFLQAGVYFTIDKYLAHVNSSNEKNYVIPQCKNNNLQVHIHMVNNLTNVDVRECEYQEICNIRFTPNLFLRARSKSVE